VSRGGTASGGTSSAGGATSIGGTTSGGASSTGGSTAPTADDLRRYYLYGRYHLRRHELHGRLDSPDGRDDLRRHQLHGRIQRVHGGTASGGTASTEAHRTGGTAHTGPWRIVPLGDSITGTTCYPQLLSQLLIKAGRSNFTLVGSQLNNQACNGAPNVQSEGMAGIG